MEILRGDVVLVAFPYVAQPARRKVRPAVVVQNEVGNRYSPNLIVAAISSRIPGREYPTNVLIRQGSPEAGGSGLDQDSVVHGELILTIPKAGVIRRLGRFGPKTMARVDACLRASLSLD